MYGFTLQDVSSPTPDTPVATTTEGEDGGEVHIRIGDPDEFVTGEHVYVITYVLDHALNAFDDHDELYWDAIGTGWNVPIDQVSVTVSGPADITEVDCFTGWEGATDACPVSTVENGRAVFGGESLDPNDGFTVVAALPKGAVPEPSPTLRDRHPIRRAFDAQLGRRRGRCRRHARRRRGDLVPARPARA